MVCLGPGGWSLAPGEAASAVARGEGDPLPLGEGALLPPDVEHLPVPVEPDRHRPRLAHVPLDGGDAHRVRLAFESRDPAPLPQVPVGDVQLHDRAPGAEHAAVVDEGSETEALSEFVGGSTLTGNQLAFVNLLVDQLTARGAVDPELLFESPYTDLAPTGPSDLFTDAQVTSLVAALRHIRATAEAS